MNPSSVTKKIILWDVFKTLCIHIGADISFFVLWLIFGGIFFMIKMRFINIRGFRQAMKLVSGKYQNQKKKEVSYFQTLTIALSAKIG